MTSMIEKAARAIMMAGHCGKQSGGEWHFCETECLCFKEARAAVEAIRKPSEQMVKVGGIAVDSAELLNLPNPEFGQEWEPSAVAAWQAMIDAILNEGK